MILRKIQERKWKVKKDHGKDIKVYPETLNDQLCLVYYHYDMAGSPFFDFQERIVFSGVLILFVFAFFLN